MTGLDNFDTPDFYGVEYLSGDEIVTRIELDISIDPDAEFDLDGNANFGNSNLPIVFPNPSGLDANDISFSWPGMDDGEVHPSLLSIFIQGDGLRPGDSFEFGLDTDFFGPSTETSGDIFALEGARYTVHLESGFYTSGGFEVADGVPNSSIAIVTIPEPSTGIALMAAAASVASSRSRRFRKHR